MRFLLDTDTISYAIRGQGRVSERLLTLAPSDIGVSAISVAELRFGAHKRRSKKLHGLIDSFLEPILEVPFDSDAANRFGMVASELRSSGTPIGLMDTLIAAHAITLDVTLVTHNSRHFGQIRGLETVDWF